MVKRICSSCGKEVYSGASSEEVWKCPYPGCGADVPKSQERPIASSDLVVIKTVKEVLE